MTNWLWLFLAFYILAIQPALLGWMLNNCGLYQLAGLNAGVFFIARVISAMCKPNKEKSNDDNTTKLIEKSEEKVSRIENNNGIAIVEVEKKTEVVVAQEDETQKENTEKEDWEEKLEEKLEDKSEERPMRENITIPKIVQPLTWHQTPKKRKKERKWGQRIILLLTLGVATIIARTLREFLGNRWIWIALFFGRILYLVIGKLFDINWFYNAKKLFTNRLYIILILAWIVYWIYTTQDNASLNLIKDKAISYIKDQFDSKKENESTTNTWDIIYIFEWTGEVIPNIDIENNTGSNEWNIKNETWMIEDTEVNTWITEDIEIEENNIEVLPEITTEDQTPTLSPEEAKKQVTMWEAIKFLLEWATLSTKTNISFKYVSKSNELYPYFKTAQERWMIWTDTDPSKIVSCDTYITMKWLREWRDVGSYTKNNVKAVYWAKAEQLWKLNGCQKWKYVTKWNLH